MIPRRGSDFTGRPAHENPLARKAQAKKKAVRLSRDTVVALASEAESLDDFAARAGLSRLAAAIYLERALRRGVSIDVRRFIDSRRQSEIEEQFMNSHTSSVAKLKRLLGARADEAEIRIVRGLLQWQAAQSDW
jgi:hypothetical protein